MDKYDAKRIVIDAFECWHSECNSGEDWSEAFKARDMALTALEQYKKPQLMAWVLTIHVGYYSTDFMFNDGYQALKIVEQLAATKDPTDNTRFTLKFQEVEDVNQDEQTIQE